MEWKRETNNKMTCEICKWITINLVECVFYVFQKENQDKRDLYSCIYIYERMFSCII